VNSVLGDGESGSRNAGVGRALHKVGTESAYRSRVDLAVSRPAAPAGLRAGRGEGVGAAHRGGRVIELEVVVVPCFAGEVQSVRDWLQSRAEDHDQDANAGCVMPTHNTVTTDNKATRSWFLIVTSLLVSGCSGDTLSRHGVGSPLELLRACVHASLRVNNGLTPLGGPRQGGSRRGWRLVVQAGNRAAFLQELGEFPQLGGSEGCPGSHLPSSVASSWSKRFSRGSIGLVSDFPALWRTQCGRSALARNALGVTRGFALGNRPT